MYYEKSLFVNVIILCIIREKNNIYAILHKGCCRICQKKAIYTQSFTKVVVGSVKKNRKYLFCLRIYFKILLALKRLSTNNLEINHLTFCTAKLFIFRHLSRTSFWQEWTTMGLFQVYYSSRYTSSARSIFTSCVQHVGRYGETSQCTPDGKNIPASTLFFRRLVQKKIQTSVCASKVILRESCLSCRNKIFILRNYR